MRTIEQMDMHGHEEIVFARDEETGLRAIIAVHDTTLGPAVGGTRFFNYVSEDDALYDVLRLSRGMTFKNAAAGLKIGGGKAVIIGDPKKLKSRELFHAYGKVIQSMSGKYYTAEDVNTTTEDIRMISEVTSFVAGTPDKTGNPSPFTARGVYKGMKAGAKEKFGSDSLAGRTVAVQGVGSVGYRLCGYLHDEGAKLKVYDLNEARMEMAVKQFGATPAGKDEILTTECDVFAPCAMGAVLNTDNVKHLKCGMVAGAANNVLVDEKVCEELEELNILYLPDYIINAGGIINCCSEVVKETYDADKVNAQVDMIYDTTLRIIKLAKDEGITTYAAADEYAMAKIRGHM